MPIISGKRAFLEILKQEGVDILFGIGGTPTGVLVDADARVSRPARRDRNDALSAAKAR